MKGYKVIYQSQYKYSKYEYFSATLGAGAGVAYVLNEASRPKRGNGPLCVFDTLEDARKFVIHLGGIIYKRSNLMIFECDYIPSSETSVWYNSEYRNKTALLSTLPAGTRLATAVTLTKKVE